MDIEPPFCFSQIADARDRYYAVRKWSRSARGSLLDISLAMDPRYPHDLMEFVASTMLEKPKVLNASLNTMEIRKWQLRFDKQDGKYDPLPLPK